MFFNARKTKFSIKDQEAYMLAVEHCSDAVVIADSRGTIRYANSVTFKVMGQTPEEVIGSDLGRWGETMGKEYHKAMWETLVKDKKFFRGEIRATRKNGGTYFVYVQIFPLFDEKEEIRGFLGIERDITSDHAVIRLRARTEDLDILNKQLAKEKAEDEALLRSIGEGVVATDRDGGIMFMNEAAQMMLGWRIEDIQGKSFLGVVFVENENGEPIPSEKQPIALALKYGEKILTNTGANYYFVGKNKNRFPAAITAAPIIIDQKVTGVIVVFRDITKERDVDKMKTEFLSLASHQLRTPLTAIRLFTEMLFNEKRGKLNQDQKEYLDNISQSTQRMIALVNDLLNISRIETGRLKIEPKPLDLPRFIKEVIGELDPLAREHSCDILFEKPKTEMPLVPIDSNLLREVLRNLFANAIRYSRAQNCNIAVRLEKYASMSQEAGLRLADPRYAEGSVEARGATATQAGVTLPDDFRHKGYKGYYLIGVRDGGIGIPKNVQSRIFEKFFRADNAMKTEAEGTGLGLYVVKMIMEASGGAVWFESPVFVRKTSAGREEGYGTTFYVTIPEEGMQPRAGERGLAA